MNLLSMKRLLYLILLAVLTSTSFCVRQKPLYYEEGVKRINNTEIYYKIMGKGLPLVFVHGGPGLEHTYFLPHMKKLTNDYQLIFYDQRYSGRSGGKVDSVFITMDQFIEDLEGLRVALNLGKMNLVGHSFGGLLTQYYAIKYPENLKSQKTNNKQTFSNHSLTSAGVTVLISSFCSYIIRHLISSHYRLS